MESLVINPSFWAGRRVLVTGHTGFKGSWISFWLTRLGAKVSGYAKAPENEPALYGLLGLTEIDQAIADIADARQVAEHMAAFQPEIVLHLAAQALVRRSYEAPMETFTTNVMGVAAVLDAVRRTPSVRAVVSVASDKCYENREWVWGYRETDALGGHDPYSASKGAAEIVVSAMRRSFFAPYRTQGHPARIATVRAGNVIGGGDWSPDRLVPDIIRSCLQGGVVRLRSPRAVRPWQHVLEPISAYLALAERLCTAEPGIDDAFNFGPADDDSRPVLELAQMIVSEIGSGAIMVDEAVGAPHEANHLTLDCARARSLLGWRPRLTLNAAISMTAEWYKKYSEGEDPRELTARQIDRFQAMPVGFAQAQETSVCIS